MTQTALNGTLSLSADTWTLVSEINCTIQNIGLGEIEIICKDGAAPAVTEEGLRYSHKVGERTVDDVLAMFPGAGTADRIYAISRAKDGKLFVSRAAVA